MPHKHSLVSGSCRVVLWCMHGVERAMLPALQALTLERDAFHALLGRLDSLRSMWRFEALQRVPLFSHLDAKTKAAVAAALGQVSIARGTAVVTQVKV